MRVSSTEVQNNFGRYLNIACDEGEVIVTKNGKDAVKIVPYGKDSYIEERAADYMLIEKGKVSYEEFLELVEKSELRYELIDGVVYNLSSPKYIHQLAISEIFAFFHNWFKGKKCKPILAPFDVTLYKGEKSINVVQPDILIICDTDKIDEEGRYKGIPTLVVEIISASSRRNDFVKKLDLYMQTGVKEYWIVDPVKKEIYIYNFEENDIKNYKTYKGDDIVASAIFDGLEMKLTDLLVSNL